MKNLKYSNYDIVFQEVPNETTLVFNVTGCPHKCEGCHSDYLWNYFGENLIDTMSEVIDKYSGMITCVCLMGGDQNLEDIKQALDIIKSKDLKTCLYSGLNSLDCFMSFVEKFDYLKIGSYMKALGGLDNPNTNQRFYQITHNKNGFELVSQNHLFLKKY